MDNIIVIKDNTKNSSYKSSNSSDIIGNSIGEKQ